MKKSTLFYAAVTVGIAVGSVIAIPILTDYLEKHQNSQPEKKTDHYDWKPEMVKTENSTEEKNNEGV